MNASELLKIARKGRKVEEYEVDVIGLENCMKYRKLKSMILYEGSLIKYFDELHQFGCMNSDGKTCGICNIGISFMIPRGYYKGKEEFCVESNIEKFKKELLSCGKEELHRFIRIETFCSCMTAESSMAIPMVSACTHEYECSRCYNLTSLMACRSKLKLHGLNYVRGYVKLPDRGKDAIPVHDYMEHVKRMALGQVYNGADVIRANDRDLDYKIKIALSTCQPIKLGEVLKKAQPIHMDAVKEIYGWEKSRREWIARCQC